MIESKRKEGETPASLYFRFSKKVRQSGVLLEMRRRRFKGRPSTKRKVRLSAKHREKKIAEIGRKKKLGLL